MPSSSTSSSLGSRIRFCHCREKVMKVDDVICEHGKEVICEQMEKIASLSVVLAKSKKREKAVSVKAEKFKMKLNVVSVCLALSWVIIEFYIAMIVAIIIIGFQSTKEENHIGRREE
ncbi:hypothetical protein FCV25MIE_20072 [Fagus crenata]